MSQASLLILLFSPLALAVNDNVSWPNSFPKQIAAGRRRPGLTTAEYLYHHTAVHGQKSWNAPDTTDQPVAYVQDHVFDSAYGVNTSWDTVEPTWFGHSDITELYSRSADAFFQPSPNNYTDVVIGPDGAAFNEFTSNLNMYSYEKFQNVSSTCGLPTSHDSFNAFYWIFANASNSHTSSFDNTTFAAAIMDSFLTDLPQGTINNASIHTPVPGTDSRPYYGGTNNPGVNAVLKFWLCDDNLSVNSFRTAQLALINKNDQLGINFQGSFVLFTRPVLIYDRQTETGSNLDRYATALLKDRYRGDVAGPPDPSN